MGPFVFAGNTTVGRVLAENLVASGLSAAPSLQEAEVAVTYCTSQESLEELYFGGDGLIAQAAPGVLLIDLSATTPTFAKELNTMATVSGMRAVEAPLLVKDPCVQNAFGRPSNLIALAAGSDEDVDVAEPLLAALAEKVVRCGEAGSAQLVKCAETLRRAGGLLAVVEADALVHAAQGPSGAALLAGALGGLGADAEVARRLLSSIEEKQFDSHYTIEALLNEVECAMTAADDIDLVLPSGEAIESLLRLLATIGGVNRGVAALSLLYRGEDECAAGGLDWSLAERAYARFDDADDDEGRHHHHYFDDLDDYSAN